ncbi:Xaa-Pro peptidase family protein [bacterium]|nr:Xaa-Pro peptidase family protein [bacterium]
MNYFEFSSKEFQKRIEHFQNSMMQAGIEGALLFQRVDQLYLTGSSFQGALLVPAQGTTTLYVWKGVDRISSNFPHEVVQLRNIGRLAEEIEKTGYHRWNKVGIETDVLPYAIWQRVCLKIWKTAEYKDVSMLLRMQRSVKSDAELNLVRVSGRILSSGFESLREHIRPGLRENVIQGMMELHMRAEGDHAAVRTRGFNAEAKGVVASGSSGGEHSVFDGPLPQPGCHPYVAMGAGLREIEPGVPIIVDTTANYHGYMTDMTRSFYIDHIESKFVEAHQFCVEIIEEMRRRMVPGAIPEELYLWSINEAQRLGFGKHYMNRGNDQVRFLGHGVGLEMDEFPVLAKRFTDPLQENMVIAVEPKIVFDEGAVGVEDTVIVKEGGAEVVTKMELELVKIS